MEMKTADWNAPAFPLSPFGPFVVEYWSTESSGCRPVDIGDDRVQRPNELSISPDIQLSSTER